MMCPAKCCAPSARRARRTSGPGGLPPETDQAGAAASASVLGRQHGQGQLLVPARMHRLRRSGRNRSNSACDVTLTVKNGCRVRPAKRPPQVPWRLSWPRRQVTDHKSECCAQARHGCSNGNRSGRMAESPHADALQGDAAVSRPTAPKSDERADAFHARWRHSGASGRRPLAAARLSISSANSWTTFGRSPRPASRRRASIRARHSRAASSLPRCTCSWPSARST